MNEVPAISIESLVELALTGDHSALAALIQSKHAGTVMHDHEISLRQTTTGLMGAILENHAGEVVARVLYFMSPYFNSPEILSSRHRRGMKPRLPQEWAHSLNMLLDRYPPKLECWRLIRPMVLSNDETVDMPNELMLAKAISSGRQDVIDLCLAYAPNEEGRTIRISDGLEDVFRFQHGAELLKYVLDNPLVKLAPDLKHPEEGLDRLALRAVLYNNLGIVKELASRGVDFGAPLRMLSENYWDFSTTVQSDVLAPSQREMDRCFPIFLANSSQMVELLESLGADLHVSSSQVANGENAVVFALRRNSLSHLKYLVEQRGFAVNVHNDEGFTPLHYAVPHNIAEMVSYLLGAGASATVRNHAGWTSMRGVYTGTQPLTKLKQLLAHGANIFDRNFEGDSDLADIRGARDIAFVGQLILDAIKNEEADKAAGRPIANPVDKEVVSDFLVNAINRKQVDMALSVMRTSAWDPEVLGYTKTSPAHAFIAAAGARGAVRGKDDECWAAIDLALTKGLDIEFRDGSGYTPLMAAVSNRNLKMMDDLIGRGADLNVGTVNGRPLASLTRDKAVRMALNSRITADAVGDALDASAADGVERASAHARQPAKKPSFSPL